MIQVNKILKRAHLGDALELAGLAEGEDGFKVVPEYHLEDAPPCLAFRFEGQSPSKLLVALGVVLARAEGDALAMELAEDVGFDEPFMGFLGWKLEN